MCIICMENAGLINEKVKKKKTESTFREAEMQMWSILLNISEMEVDQAINIVKHTKAHLDFNLLKESDPNQIRKLID